jgi:very-short-patch-repair endonuclease
MACGPSAVLSHRAAADLLRLRPNATLVEVTVPEKRAGPPGVRVHQSRMLAAQDVTVLDGIRVTSVARTLLDLSAVVKTQDLEVAIDRAERLRIFDLSAVIETLERANGKRGATALRRAIAAYEPSTQKSELERRFKQLLRTAPDLPSPFFNAAVDGELATHEVDAFWAEQRLAVQLDGFEFHRTRRDREQDANSDADLELAGHRVLRLTWDDVTVHGERTLRRIRLVSA